jgi:hypothetical protein
MKEEHSTALLCARYVTISAEPTQCPSEFKAAGAKLQEQRIFVTLVFGWICLRVFSWNFMLPFLERRNVRVLLDKARGHALSKRTSKNIEWGPGLLRELTCCER